MSKYFKRLFTLEGEEIGNLNQLSLKNGKFLFIISKKILKKLILMFMVA